MSNFNKEILNSLASEITGWIKNDYLLDSHLVSVGFVDGKKINKNLLADLGDYLPFLYLFGAEDFAEKQIKESEKILKNGLVSATRKKLGIDIMSSYDHTDLILGLIDYYNLSKDEEVKTRIEKIFTNTIKNFSLNKIPHSFYLPQLNLHLPILDTRDGMFIELMIEWFRITRNPKYLDNAMHLFKLLVNTPFFKKNKLFPKFIYFGIGRGRINRLPKFNDVLLMKHNTNTLFAFLELYKETKKREIKDIIYEWFEALDSKMIKNGLVYNDLKGDTSLTASFSTIDFLCDCGKIFNDKDFIVAAQKVANFWIQKQSKTTGLFPRKSNEFVDDLDCCTDMFVALAKLHELTNDEAYKVSAKRCFAGIIKYHRKKGGYCLNVNIKNGEVVDGQFKTKFITLFLKAVYLYIKKIEGKNIYTDKKLFDLLKDR